MGTYRNVKCGFCKYSFTDGYQLYDGPRVKLGYPFIKCPQCGRLNRTGMLPWSKFNKGDKILFWLKACSYGIVIGGFLSVLIVLIFCEIFGFDSFQDNFNNILFTFIIGSGIGNLIVWNAYKKEIKEIEEVIKSKEYQDYFKK